MYLNVPRPGSPGQFCAARAKGGAGASSVGLGRHRRAGAVAGLWGVGGVATGVFVAAITAGGANQGISD